MRPRAPALLLTLLGLAVSPAAGCRDPLRDQRSIQPYERPLLTVPAGAVPVSSEGELEPAATLERAAELPNPLPADEETLRLGERAYGRYCRPCHGDLGRGWTSIGSSLDPRPADLVQALEGKSDGRLFGHITFGTKTAPALGPSITVIDRWRIVHFLRTLERRREALPPDWPQ